MLRRLLDEETAQGGGNEAVPREEAPAEVAAGVSPAPEGVGGIGNDLSNAMTGLKDNAVEQLSNRKWQIIVALALTFIIILDIETFCTVLEGGER